MSEADPAGLSGLVTRFHNLFLIYQFLSASPPLDCEAGNATGQALGSTSKTRIRCWIHMYFTWRGTL